MKITYNGLTQPTGLITFTDIPNILKLEDTAGGTYAKITLTFAGNLTQVSSKDGDLYITILGETINSVRNYSNAVNKNFYVSTASTSVASSVSRALANCPTISANFTIEHSGSKVTLTARSVGKMWNGQATPITTNITSTYLTHSSTDGNATSDYVGDIITVNVYQNSNFVTSLSKNYYGSECAFDMSPLLTTLAKRGETLPYVMKLSRVKENGEYESIGTVSSNHIVAGYMVNQGKKYLSMAGNTTIPAQNFQRGDANPGLSNHTILYIYAPEIPVSFYKTTPYAQNITITYRNSAKEVITSTTVSFTPSTDSNNLLKETTLQLDRTTFNNSFYVDVAYDTYTIRYNVIKPLKATEYNQRIFFRCSYGGVAFIDMSGSKTETRELKTTTYQKNIYGYYDDDMNELDKVYDNEVTYTVTLKSHLMENDAKYIFNDLMQSQDVWVYRNSQKYAIIIESVSVDEIDRNNIWEATIRYKFSQNPSLI